MTVPRPGPVTVPRPAARPAVRPGARTGRAVVPSLREERRLHREGHTLVAGVDEVGRGALAGPVTVGVVVVRDTTRTAPSGLRDSKLLSPLAREALAPALRRWAPAWAVGHAEPDEIDAVGIIAALRVAGRRALAQLDLVPDIVLLDGSHDWLSTRALQEPLFELEAAGPPVRTMIKADLRCAAVAAASVLAKTTRDAMMVERSADHPGYGWHENKGYSAPEHLDELARVGPCVQHRLSWRLPGCAPFSASEHDVDGHARPGPDDVPLLDSLQGLPDGRAEDGGAEASGDAGGHVQAGEQAGTVLGQTHGLVSEGAVRSERSAEAGAEPRDHARW